MFLSKHARHAVRGKNVVLDRAHGLVQSLDTVFRRANFNFDPLGGVDQRLACPALAGVAEGRPSAVSELLLLDHGEAQCPSVSRNQAVHFPFELIAIIDATQKSTGKYVETSCGDVRNQKRGA